jgi:arginyl-tRNA synthetase
MQRMAAAFATVTGEPVDPVVRRSKHADFQSDGALALSRKLSSNPRAIAEQVVAAAQLDDVCKTTFAITPPPMDRRTQATELAQLASTAPVVVVML